MTPRIWHRVRRHLHWWTAVLLVLGFTVAWVMTALPLAMLLMKFLLYQAHKSIGLIVFGLTILRLALAWRARDRPRGMTALLYGLLLIVPVLGYLTAVASPTMIPTLFLMLVSVPHVIAPDAAAFAAIRPVHEWLAIGLVALAVWHGTRMLRGPGPSVPRMARSANAHPPAKSG